MARIRVFLVEDHDMVRRGVAELLDEEPDIVVVGEASTAAQALREAPLMGPHVAVLDLRLPDGDGVTLCRELRSRLPGVRCLMLTSLSEEDALLAAVMGGASGYRVKQVRGADLPAAVREVATRRSMLDEQAVADAWQRLRSSVGAAESLTGLSDRERTMLDLMAAGLTNREIGERLPLDEQAVHDSVRRLLAKLGVQRLTGVTVSVDLPSAF